MVNTKTRRSIYSVLFLDSIAIFLVLPIIFFLIFQSSFFPFLATTTLRAKWFLFVLVIIAFPLGQCIGVPFIGNTIDRTNKKRIFLLAIFGEAIGFFLSFGALYLHSLFFFTISRFITGFFTANFSLCFSLLTHNCKGPVTLRRAAAKATLTIITGFIVAIILATCFSDTSLDSFASPQYPFLIGGILTIANWCVVYFSKGITFSKGSSRTSHWFTKVKTILKTHPKLKHSIILLLLLMITISSPLAFFSSLILGKYGLGKLALCGLFILLAAIWIASLLLSNATARLFRKNQAVFLALVALLLCSLILSYSLPFLSFIFVFCIFQWIASLLSSLIFSQVAEFSPAGSRGLALGSAQSIGFFAGTLGPIFSLIIISSTHTLKMSNLFIVSALFSFIALTYFIFSKRR